MGLEVLFWIWVLTWMTKTAATDVLHAVKGTPNPRYELKKAKAAQTGRPVDGQPRYGTREWFADLYSDALAAHTERRRKAAAARAQPVDDMVDVVRERPVPRQRRPSPEPEWLTPDPDAEPQTMDRLDLEEGMQPIGDYEKPTCAGCGATYAQPGSANCPACDRAQGDYPEPDTRPLAPVIPMFPNPKQIEKEITMANSEVTGLTTAAAFAEQAAAAHQAFTTAGTEGYVGALEQMGFGPGVIGLAGEAREASANASAKWTALKDAMDEFVGGREFYQSNPDAPEKAALVNE